MSKIREELKENLKFLGSSDELTDMLIKNAEKSLIGWRIYKLCTVFKKQVETMQDFSDTFDVPFNTVKNSFWWASRKAKMYNVHQQYYWAVRETLQTRYPCWMVWKEVLPHVWRVGVRLAVLILVEKGEMNTAEIEAFLGVSKSTINRLKRNEEGIQLPAWGDGNEKYVDHV